MYKIAWNEKMDMKKDKSKTTRFLQFLVKIFLIPFTINPTKNEISFMFWSRPTMIHIILYWVPFLSINIYCYYLGEVSGLTNHYVSNYSTPELYSNWIMYIVQLVILLPFMTCYQLGKRKLKADWFLSFDKCPGHAWCNILSMIFQFFGSFAFFYAKTYTYALEFHTFITLIVLYIVMFIINAVFWALSAFFVEIWMENLLIENEKNNFIFNSKRTIDNYNKLSQGRPKND